MDLTQLVGRENAEAFVAGRVPVTPGDECVLFLWYRPGSTTWSILQWPLQFRRQKNPSESATPVLARPWLTASWFGPTVPVAPTVTAAAGTENVRLSWEALVNGVRQPAKALK